MHYYQFNIGDYASHTRHLTIIEDIAYRRLLDMYYLHEKPLDSSIEAVARLIGMREYVAEVEMVMLEFFECLPPEGEIHGWVNTRADKEISAYKGFIEAGKRGASKRWAKNDSPPIAPLYGNDSPPIAPPIANTKQEPITNNQEPIKSNTLVITDKSVSDRVPYEAIVNLYHKKLPTLPKVVMLTAKRRGQIGARWKSGVLPDIETWGEFFTMVSDSQWLMGKIDPPEGRKRFVADLEWITNESNFTKIWEGKYHGAR